MQTSRVPWHCCLHINIISINQSLFFTNWTQTSTTSHCQQHLDQLQFCAHRTWTSTTEAAQEHTEFPMLPPYIFWLHRIQNPNFSHWSSTWRCSILLYSVNKNFITISLQNSKLPPLMQQMNILSSPCYFNTSNIFISYRFWHTDDRTQAFPTDRLKQHMNALTL